MGNYNSMQMTTSEVNDTVFIMDCHLLWYLLKQLPPAVKYDRLETEYSIPTSTIGWLLSTTSERKIMDFT
jgi:hypothetical protein